MEELEVLAQNLRAAKSTENKAKEFRVKAEEAVIALTGCQEDGSKTHDSESFKITVKGGLRYTCDMEALEKLDIIPVLMPVKTEVKFDAKGYKWLRENETEVFKKVASCVTVKPAKPSVTLKVKE